MPLLPRQAQLRKTDSQPNHSAFAGQPQSVINSAQVCPDCVKDCAIIIAICKGAGAWLLRGVGNVISLLHATPHEETNGTCSQGSKHFFKG